MSDTMITAALVSGDLLCREPFGRLGAHIGVAVQRQAQTVDELIADGAAMPELIIIVGWEHRRRRVSGGGLPAARSGPRVAPAGADRQCGAAADALGAAGGRRGFLHRNMSSEALSHSIRLIMYGQAVVPMSVVSKFLEGRRQPPARRGRADRGGREPDPARARTFLSLLAEGQPNKVIARRLGTCDGTVKVHLRRIMRKLGVQNRTQAAIWALDHLQGHEPRELAS